MIFIGIVVVGIILGIASYFLDAHCHDFASAVCGIPAIVLGIVAIIMIIILSITYIDCPSTEAVWREEYTSLNTRIEEHMYYPWDRMQLITEVQNWNEKFAAHEASHNNFWVGIFNPQSIDGLSKIDLERIK